MGKTFKGKCWSCGETGGNNCFWCDLGDGARKKKQQQETVIICGPVADKDQGRKDRRR
jgi:hypothetical protein